MFALFRLGAGREERDIELGTVLVASAQFLLVDGAALLVLLVARACEVAADNTLKGDD